MTTSISTRTQIANIARRSILRTLRQPANVAFPIVFPLLILAVNVGGLESATKIPGFPAGSVLDYLLAFTFMQGALFAATGAGTDIARDIETGFMSRLSLTPIGPTALLVGQLAGVLALGLLQALAYLSVALAAGGSIEAGPVGVLLLLALAELMALAFGGIGAAMALRTGSGEVVQGLFPLLFVTLFISSAIMPRNLIETDWFHTVATYNPVSYLIEGIRSLIISGWDGEALALCIGLGVGIATVALLSSRLLLKSVLVR